MPCHNRGTEGLASGFTEATAFSKTIDSSQNLTALRSFLCNSYQLIARAPILEFTFLFGSRSRENGGIRAVLSWTQALGAGLADVILLAGPDWAEFGDVRYGGATKGRSLAS